uniref:ATPase AAA-type core domain-containing protein n=1 Tax=Aegilops tauschii subsp. strangulata TaxID=200361 RepID=A0A453RRG9_AEGTS
MAFHAENSEISSVVLPAKVLIHFEVVDGKLSRGVDFLYLLTITFENPGYNNSQGNVEITWKAPTDDLENLELNFGRLELGEALSFDSVVDDGFNNAFKLTRSSLGWMENAMSDVTKRLSVLVSSTALRLFNRLKLPFPGYVLVHGPRGSGKTALTRAAAKYFEDHQEILAHMWILLLRAEYIWIVPNLQLARLRRQGKQLKRAFLKLCFIHLLSSYLTI